MWVLNTGVSGPSGSRTLAFFLLFKFALKCLLPFCWRFFWPVLCPVSWASPLTWPSVAVCPLQTFKRNLIIQNAKVCHLKWPDDAFLSICMHRSLCKPWEGKQMDHHLVLVKVSMQLLELFVFPLHCPVERAVRQPHCVECAYADLTARDRSDLHANGSSTGIKCYK